MKKIQLMLLALSSLFSFTVYAGDICSQLPGFWHGETHLKNSTECAAFNGCTHIVTANTERLNDNKLHVKFTFTDGTQVQKQELDINCQDGNIILPITTKYTLSTDCDATNHCFIFYDTAKFSAELVNS